MSKLYIIKEPMGSKSFDIPGEVLPLGRPSGNEIQVNDEPVPLNHLCMHQKEGRREEKMTADQKTMARGMAHCINNLLMVIQGNVSLLQLDLKPEKRYHERLTSIEKHVQLGATLTSRMLAYSGLGRFSTEKIDCNHLIEKIVEQSGCDCGPVRVIKRFEPSLWKIKGDPEQIRQALTELLVNAREAMPRCGKIVFHTENRHFEKNSPKPDGLKQEHYIKITVTDQGIGMDRETQLKAFEPFYSKKARMDRPGLGLAAAQGIIHHHEGAITLDSQEGHGATFQIYLPALVSENQRSPE